MIVGERESSVLKQQSSALIGAAQPVSMTSYTTRWFWDTRGEDHSQKAYSVHVVRLIL